MAVGVAISPLRIIAVVLILATPRGRVNGPAFLVGSILGMAAAGTAVLLIAGGVGADDESGPTAWVSWLKLALGVLVLALAVQQWRGRTRRGEEPTAPKWMAALDSFTPPKAAGAGVVVPASTRRTWCSSSREPGRSRRRGCRPASRPLRWPSSF